jgi:hypothetical protein
LIKLNLPKQTLEKLQELISGNVYDFLGFKLNLETGILNDTFNINSMKNPSKRDIQIFYCLLNHYAAGNHTLLRGKLVKFKDLPGGYAYEGAFIQRAIQPIAEVFGETPKELIEAAKLLGGVQMDFGDASVQIPALKGIPLTYILWKADEFAASASILYDESASNYLPTEDLSGIGEITTSRLIEAKLKLS